MDSLWNSKTVSMLVCLSKFSASLLFSVMATVRLPISRTSFTARRLYNTDVYVSMAMGKDKVCFQVPDR